MNPQQGEAGVLAAPGMGMRGESGMNPDSLASRKYKNLPWSHDGFVVGVKQWSLYFTENVPVWHEQDTELTLRIWSLHNLCQNSLKCGRELSISTLIPSLLGCSSSLLVCSGEAKLYSPAVQNTPFTTLLSLSFIVKEHTLAKLRGNGSHRCKELSWLGWHTKRNLGLENPHWTLHTLPWLTGACSGFRPSMADSWLVWFAFSVGTRRRNLRVEQTSPIPGSVQVEVQ